MALYKLFWVAPLFAVIAVCCCILSTGAPKWVDDKDSYSGIWKGCSIKSDSKVQCKSLPANARLNTSRAFSLISILLFIATGGLSIHAFFKNSAVSSLLAMLTTLTQGISMMIALLVFLRYKDNHLGWAYAFGWIGFLFHLFGAGAFAVQVFMVRRLSQHTYVPINRAAT